MRAKLLFLGLFLFTNIYCYAQVPANNDCANAEIINITTTNTTLVSFNNSMATQSLLSSCDTSATPYLDVWYEFTMPVNGNIQITSVNFADGFSLYNSCDGAEIACFYDDGFFYNLSAGTYKLRAVSTLANAGTDNFRIQAFEAAANDECATAEVIMDDITSQRVINFDARGATESLDASCDTASNTYLDIWYEFTMPVNGNLVLSSVNSLDRFTLYDSCGGAEISCSNGNTFVYNLSVGTYLLRVYSRSIYTTSDLFRIQAFETAANDECATAEVITDDIMTQRTINFDNRAATESLDASCDTASNTYLDIWYEFTMPVNGNLHLSGANGIDRFTLYDGCGGAEIVCSNNNTFVYNLTAGTYYLRAYSRSIYASTDSFRIQAFETAANDECATAEVITDDITTQRTLNFDNRAATESLDAGCDTANNTYLDVWYEFTMPVNGNIHLSGANGLDRFTLYDSCGGAEIACSSSNTFVYNLTIGTYYLRAYSRSIYASADSFNIQAFETAANDECATAEIITDDITTERTITYDNRAATESLDASCDTAGNTHLDIWYEFTMPVNGNVRITGVNSLDRFTLYDSCGGIELTCFYDDGFAYNLTIGTYYLRVYSRSIHAFSDSFNIQAFEQLTNDDCVNAQMISVAGIGACVTQNVTVDLRGAKETFAPNIGSCFNTAQTWMEAWYTFEAPITGNINLTSTSVNNRFAVYDGCAGAEIACFSDDGVIPVVFGNTYYIQVARTANFSNEATFCLEGAPEVAQGMAGICESIPSVEISATQGNTNEWVPILDASGAIVAALNANGNDLGIVNSTLFIDNSDTRTFSGQPYLRREVSINPTNAPVGNVSVRIYILEDEVTDLITADANLDVVNELSIMKVAGNTCSGGYTSGGDFIGTTETSYGNDYYMSFNTNSFSVFYPSSTNLSSTLSVSTVESTNSGISITPTVTSGILNIASQKTIRNAEIYVYDITGRITAHKTLNVINSNSQSVDISNQKQGIYFVKIKTEDSQFAKKVILK